jgi:periplasmic protein TonB
MDPASHLSASPFGVLIEEAEHEAVRRHGTHPHRLAPPRSDRAPELLFETLAERDAVGLADGRRRLTVPVSMAVHAAGVAAIIVIPLLMSQSMPEAASGVRAFLVEPSMAAPAPPPPPPAPRSAAVPKVAPAPVPDSGKFVAPVEVPTEIKPESDLGLIGGAEGGVPGGVEGGVPGGVVGGIVGGLPDAPPPAPAVKPVRVGGFIKEPKRTRYIAPEYPKLAVQARLQGVVIIEATIDDKGRVVDAKVLRGLPMLDQAALDAVRQWVYTPTFLDGHPTPVLMVVTVNFMLSGESRS